MASFFDDLTKDQEEPPPQQEPSFFDALVEPAPAPSVEQQQPPQQQQPGLSRDEGGQLMFKTAPVSDIAPPGLRRAGQVFDVAGQALVSGAREAAVGVGMLATEIVAPEHLFGPGPGNLAKRISRNIPKIEADSIVDETASGKSVV